MTRAIIAFLVTGGLALAQLDSNTITITASRTSNVTQNQVTFNVGVNTAADANFSDALAVVSPLGLSAGDLSSLNTVATYDSRGRPNGSQLQWSFGVTAPIASFKDTFAKLQIFAQNAKGVSIGVLGSQTSPQQCQPSDLIADARAQGQALANAAGVTLGPILGTSSAPSAAGGIGFAVPTLAFRSGDFIGGAGLASFLLATPVIAPVPQATCSLTVKFSLLRYQ